MAVAFGTRGQAAESDVAEAGLLLEAELQDCVWTNLSIKFHVCSKKVQ